MRKTLVVFGCMVVVVAVGAVLTLRAASAATAPDVKVTFLGVTNVGVGAEDARFHVQNFGESRICVLEVGIQACEPFESLSLPGTILAKPVVVESGGLREFRTPLVSVTSRWRGSVTIALDTPRQRFRHWLLKQPWRGHLPRKCLPNRSGVYIFSSPWQEDKSLNPRL